MTIYLFRGLPGSGKTTAAYQLSNTDDVVVCADDYFTNGFDPALLTEAHEWCFQRALDGMKQGRRVFVHNTFTREWEMYRYIKEAKEHGYKVVSLIVENRHGNKSVHNVPETTMQKMKDRFECML